MIMTELHERRRLFFAVMRRPEMRLVRAALWDLKWEHDTPWEGVTELEIAVFKTGIWILRTDRHLSICYEPEASKPDFQVQSY